MALTKFNYNSFDVTPVASNAMAFNSGANGLTTMSGAITLIKTLTASSSGTLSFVDGSSDVVLDNTYKTYFIKFTNCHPSSDGVDFLFNLSADTGSNYNVTKTSTYFYSYTSYAISGLVGIDYNTSFDLAQGTGVQTMTNNIGSDNDQSASGELWLFNPSSTTYVKHFMGHMNSYHGSDQSHCAYFAGYGNTTSAVDAIQFTMQTGNIDAGTFKLYGIKDS